MKDIIIYFSKFAILKWSRVALTIKMLKDIIK